jgi:hypothetical protein
MLYLQPCSQHSPPQRSTMIFELSNLLALVFHVLMSKQKIEMVVVRGVHGGVGRVGRAAPLN